MLERYNFSDDFQDMILACLIRHPIEFRAFGEVIQPGFFNGPSAIETVFHLRKFVDQYSKYPTFTVLGNYVHQKIGRRTPEKSRELSEYVLKLSQISTEDWKAVLDMSVAFAKERALYDALKKIHLAQSNPDDDGVQVDPVKLVEEALKVGTDSSTLGLHLGRDLEYVIDELSKTSFGVNTGFAEFDKVWKMGWGPGWLIVPLAPPKCYKSTFALNLAFNMVRANNDVVYYACEISDKEAMLRMVNRMSGQTGDQLFESPERYKLAARKSYDSSGLSSSMCFKGFASKTVTVSQLKQHTKQLIAEWGIKPRAIFIDYAETVKPTHVNKSTPDYRLQAEVYVESRAMGSELGCAIIMPDRCNKDTVNRAVPNMASFQGSFEKAGAVDLAIGLCATSAEHLQRKIRYFVFLNRHGEQFLHFEGKVDPERFTMTVDKQIEYEPEEDGNDAPFKRKRTKGKAPDSDDLR